MEHKFKKVEASYFFSENLVFDFFCLTTKRNDSDNEAAHTKRVSFYQWLCFSHRALVIYDGEETAPRVSTQCHHWGQCPRLTVAPQLKGKIHLFFFCPSC